MWLQAKLKKEMGIDVDVVNNGVDSSEFKPWPVPKDPARPRIVTFGKPISWKGFQDAAAAMQIVRTKHPQVEWVVFGYRPDLPPDNPMAPYKFVGALLGDNLAKLYSSADVVLCPSWYESFPLPPLEAMACATAVVTTRPGTEDYATDRVNSLVVPARDTQAMSSAVIELIEDMRLRQRLAESGYATAKRMTWERATASFEAALFKAVATSGEG